MRTQHFQKDYKNRRVFPEYLSLLKLLKLYTEYFNWCSCLTRLYARHVGTVGFIELNTYQDRMDGLDQQHIQRLFMSVTEECYFPYI
jgi:hypothetical protein